MYVEVMRWEGECLGDVEEERRGEGSITVVMGRCRGGIRLCCGNDRERKGVGKL